jgi:phosphoglycolate phosphatase
MARRLIIFDCDGTLVDSQHSICDAMDLAFTSLGLKSPHRADVLGIVGLSLPEAFAVLARDHPDEVQRDLVQHYRSHFPQVRQTSSGHDPLYAGMREAVVTLAQRGDTALGIATGKSQRGVKRLLDREGWHDHFVTIQTADENPSKPHPSMILQAMADAGVAPDDTLMIGDTSFDMEMARNARVGALGVAWGYHTTGRLQSGGAHAIVHETADLLAAIDGHFALRKAEA